MLPNEISREEINVNKNLTKDLTQCEFSSQCSVGEKFYHTPYWGIIGGMSGACLGIIWGVPGACLGHHLGHVWALYGACLGHHKGHVWVLYGAFLGHVWGMSGHYMGRFLGILRGMSGACLGITWGVSGASSGACLWQSVISAVLHTSLMPFCMRTYDDILNRM